MIEDAFPLQWPEGQPRASSRREGWAFKVTQDQAQAHLRAELRRMGATDVIISTDIPIRKDGLPYAGAAEPKDQGVAVYFTHGKRRLVIACDSYSKLRWNMRACGLTVEALRSIQRHGATELLDRAFTGFAALPPKGGTLLPWREVLGVGPGATYDEARAAYRECARVHHPDVGGNAEKMMQVNAAWAAAELEFKR